MSCGEKKLGRNRNYLGGFIKEYWDNGVYFVDCLIGQLGPRFGRRGPNNPQFRTGELIYKTVLQLFIQVTARPPAGDVYNVGGERLLASRSRLEIIKSWCTDPTEFSKSVEENRF